MGRGLLGRQLGCPQQSSMHAPYLVSPWGLRASGCWILQCMPGWNPSYHCDSPFYHNQMNNDNKDCINLHVQRCKVPILISSFLLNKSTSQVKLFIRSFELSNKEGLKSKGFWVKNSCPKVLLINITITSYTRWHLPKWRWLIIDWIEVMLRWCLETLQFLFDFYHFHTSFLIVVQNCLHQFKIVFYQALDAVVHSIQYLTLLDLFVRIYFYATVIQVFQYDFFFIIFFKNIYLNL